MHKVVARQPGFRRPDAFAQPALKRQVIANATQQRHGGMRMQVDQARNEQMAIKHLSARIWITRASLGHRQDRFDLACTYSQRMPPQHLASRNHRGDPLRHDQACLA